MNALVLAAGDVMHHLVNSREIEFGPLHLDLGKINHWCLETVGFDPHLHKHAVMMMAAAALICLVGILTARSAARTQGRGVVAHSTEAVVLFLRDEVVRPAIHDEKHVRTYFPLFATMFFFILACNLLGLFPPPFGATATGNIWITAALALVTLFTMWASGMIEKGPLGYWIGLVPHGVPWWMWPLVWIIEFFGLFTKPFALTVRLFANMTAGHVILAVMALFLVSGSAAFWAGDKGLFGLLGLKAMAGLPSLAFALFITLFEVIIALIQAYIFTILSAIFVGQSLSHEH